MIGLISKDDPSLYENQLSLFVEYCDRNSLELNVSKTKEMIIDLNQGFKNAF